jgi:hypothetical protein
VIGMGVGGHIAERHRIIRRPLDRTARIHARGITVDQQTQQRKLPRLSQKLKVELSGMFPPGGSDEDFEVHRDADRLDPQAV